MTCVTWKQLTGIMSDLVHSPVGDWTHLYDHRPVRFVQRVTTPFGLERIIYRASDHAGYVSPEQWAAKSREITPVQMTLF